MTGSVCETGVPGPVRVFPATSHCELFGYSHEGRPLIVNYCGNPGAAVRILILAGQHGDEPDAREAAAEFVQRFQSGLFHAQAHVAVIVDANPDGAALGTRRNAADIDLNRDHLLLTAPETLAVHSFAEVWRPNLIVDVHTYRAWRKELLPYDFVFPQEIMIDFPTNPAVGAVMGPALQRGAMDFFETRMAEANIRSDRYTLIRPGVVRHSTAEILDARNNLALRFEIPTLLIEGRRASMDDSLKFAEPRIALLRAMEAVVDWAAENLGIPPKKAARLSDNVPIRCRYSGTKAVRYMEMQSATRCEISTARIPGTYLPSVTATKHVVKPGAYAVPKELAGVLTVLKKHGFATAAPETLDWKSASAYRIQSLIPAAEEESPSLPLCACEPADIDSKDFVSFSARQTGGNLLSLLLEPESQFGPHRLPELAAGFQPGMLYPVVRVASR